MNFTKSALRYLSLGFFISAVLLAGFNFLAPDSSNSAQEQPSSEEKIIVEETTSTDSTAVEETDTSTSEQSSATDTADVTDSEESPSETQESENNPEDEEENTDDAASAVVVINQGDPSSFASNQLQNQGIIDSATEFNEFLEENDYTSQLRPGSYEVNRDMTFQEIAEVLMSGN